MRKIIMTLPALALGLFLLILRGSRAKDEMTIYYISQKTSFIKSPTSQTAINSPNAKIELSVDLAHFIWEDFTRLLPLESTSGKSVDSE